MAKILSERVICTVTIVNELRDAAEAYYSIKDLQSKIKKLETNIATKKNTLSRLVEKLQNLDVVIDKENAYISKNNEDSGLVRMDRLKLKSRSTCSRFIKHLKKGDLVKTVDTQDNN